MTQVDGAWTIQRVLTWSTDFLKERKLSESPRLDAELLLAHALSVPRLHLYTHFDKPLNAVEREPFKQFLMRRGSGEPVAYITGFKEFMSLSFAVTKAVLIPRPDTELVVETALAESRVLPKTLRILDVGTGSGCIAIALALRLKEATVTAWDVDPEALALAQTNGKRLGAEQITFQTMDALDAKSWEGCEPVDLLVSNPPYIAPDEEPTLHRSVIGFEPRRALFAEDGGLAFYRTFADHAGHALVPGGKMILEIGAHQGAAVSALLESRGWGQIVVKKDLARLDRVIVATCPEKDRQ